MTATCRTLPKDWSGSKDSEGHRTYKVTWIVDTDVTDGPANVFEASGLPSIGQQWNFTGIGIGADESTEIDLWAWCLAEMTATPATKAETCKIWFVEQTFSTKPPDTKRCVDQQITDPILIPPEISGEFVKYTEEAVYDRNGDKIENSAHEQIRGPKVEFDHNRQTVKIKQNYPILNLPFVSAMVDTVNDDYLWGFPPRCVKLSKAPWERKFYGTCYVYYTYTFEFDVYLTPEGTSGFDRLLTDEAHSVLHGRWGNAPGTGCTVLIDAVSPTIGGIEQVGLASGGSGYPPDQQIILVVLGGSGGTVTATTDSTGAVSGVTELREGKNYSPGTEGTQTGVGWLLIDINGVPPDQRDPTHFDQYTDKNGNPKSIILNGAGLPANQVLSVTLTPAITIYVCVCSNIGQPLDGNLLFWVPLGNSSFPQWEPPTTYNIGDTITDVPVVGGGSFDYVSLIDNNVGNDPRVTSQPFPACPMAGDAWGALPGDGFNDRGEYNEETTYNTGDQVTFTVGADAPTTGAAGSILVEKYDESDFTLLGIPLTL